LLSGADAALAPAAPPPPAPTELPHALTSFVGRERELGELARLLGRTRLVTVVGAGGSGKTRLALEAAARHGGEVRLVELAPLAIELAAARTPHLAPAQLAERLGAALDVLGTGSRAALDRQQTLRAALDWSYALLDDDERDLFARLSVMAGDFDLDAAEVVGS